MRLTVRPLNIDEVPLIVNYFHHANEADLIQMGAAAELLPTPEEWTKKLELQLKLPDREKELFYLLWCVNEKPIGHSNLSHLQYGKTAKVHLHLWSREQRKGGFGKQFMERSLEHYFTRFNLKEIICEPKAENPAPNKLIPQLGFNLLKTYTTTPGPINTKQLVHRYQLKKNK